MECQCGGKIKGSEDTAKSVKVADDWAIGLYEKADLPLSIVKYDCEGCKRFGYKVFDSSGKMIKRHNV